MLITDRVKISSNREYTDEGFLITNSRIARTGIQDYYAFELGLEDRDPTDIIKIFRPDDEVFNADSLKSFANKTITDNHPDEMINSENAKKFSVGHSGNEVVRDGMFAKTILHFTDKEIIKKIESGKVELSNGYTSDIIWKSGVTDEGIAYDAVQRNIKGNHIAVVNSGRCGASCRVSDQKPKPKEVIKMAKFIIDGVDFEATDQTVQAVGKLKTRLSDAEEKATMSEEELKKKEDEKEEMKKDHKLAIDKLQAQVDDSSSKVPTPEMLDSLVDNRIATRDAAIAIVPGIKWEGKDCETIRKEVVKTKAENVDTDKVSPDYIRARFDMLAESHLNDSQKGLNDSFRKQNNVAKDANKLSARDKFCQDSRDAWKTKGSAAS